MVLFMLHFHCYFDVQILLSHSIHFLILKTISYWPLGEFSSIFFLRLRLLLDCCFFGYGYVAIIVIFMVHTSCVCVFVCVCWLLANLQGIS